MPERWIDGAAEAANDVERSAWMAFGDGAPLCAMRIRPLHQPSYIALTLAPTCSAREALKEGVPLTKAPRARRAILHRQALCRAGGEDRDHPPLSKVHAAPGPLGSSSCTGRLCMPLSGPA